MIKILHLSDIHFGYKGTEDDQSRILQALEKTIANKIPFDELDLCVISGDIANYGLKSEFDQAEDWLVELLKDYINCKVFIAPGNHDIPRPKAGKEIRRMEEHRNSCSKSQELYSKLKDEKLYKKRFETFRKFHLSISNKLQIISNWEESIFGCCHTFENSDNDNRLVAPEKTII